MQFSWNKVFGYCVICLTLGCTITPNENRSIVLPENSNNAIDLSDLEVSNTAISPEIPDSIRFAGEYLALNDLDVRERLDRELIVNMHWHSNTIFYLKRANRWFPLMRSILIEENVPEDFLYLAVIESGLVQATSPSGAKGFWQFMEGTALEYGLVINDFVDERFHVEKSTRAACSYLRNAYNKLGSWYLAAAAYNRGNAGIQSDMNNQYMTDYFDLHLNQETSRYVFRILAVKLIFENPEIYGFDIPQNHLYPPYNVRSLRISKSIENLAQWSKENGINYKLLKLLNPWLIGQDLILRQNQEFELLLPEKDEQLTVFGGLSSN